MIANDQQFEVVQNQLRLAESILADNRRDFLPHNETHYRLFSETTVCLIRSLRAEIDAYLGLDNFCDTAPENCDGMTIRQFQDYNHEMFGEKDAKRGVDGSFMWFVEEVGELATALREGAKEELTLEFADVFAWLATIASISGIDLEDAVKSKFGQGCPKCVQIPCRCQGVKS